MPEIYKYKLVGEEEYSEIPTIMGDLIRTDNKYGPIQWKPVMLTNPDTNEVETVSVADQINTSIMERNTYTVYLALFRSGRLNNIVEDTKDYTKAENWEAFLDVIDDFEKVSEVSEDDPEYEEKVLNPTETDIEQ